MELLEPTSEDSPVAKFLANRGEGFHHVAFETDSIEEVLKTAEAQGLRLIDKEPRPGAHGTKVAFIHPKSTFGVLVELVQEEMCIRDRFSEVLSLCTPTQETVSYTHLDVYKRQGAHYCRDNFGRSLCRIH